MFCSTRTKADYRVIPWATFTDPELARVGLTEQEARERYDDIYVNRALMRWIAPKQNSRICKIITRRNGQTFGAHLVGPSAGS